MTKPDSEKKMRNVFLVLFILLAAGSYTCASTASFWFAVLDYWRVLASVATGLGAIASGIGATVMHFTYLDSLRSN